MKNKQFSPPTSEKKISFAFEKSFDCYIMKIPLLRDEHPKFKTI